MPELIEDFIEATPARSSNPGTGGAGGKVVVILPPLEPARRRAMSR